MPANQTSKLQVLFRTVGVVGILCILGGFGIAIYHASFDLTSNILVIVGLLLFMLLFIKAELANLKYYLHVFFYAVMVTGICVVAYLFARQYTWQKDLTKQHLFSLSPQSEKYLKSLEKEVTISILLPPQASNSGGIRDIQQLYSNMPKIKWVFLDSRKDRGEAMKLGDGVRDGDVFIQTDRQHSKKVTLGELFGQNSESTITNAIIEITRETRPKLYFLTGHGEVAYDQPSRMRQNQENPEPSLAAFRQFLTGRGMDTDKLNLAKSGAVPQDASMLVIAGPVSDLLQTESVALDDYLSKGGKVLVCVDVPQAQTPVPLTNLMNVLGKYGISLPEKVIIDLTTDRGFIPLVSWFNQDQPITKSLKSQMLLSMSRPVEQSPTPAKGLTMTELIKSSDRSFSQDLKTIIASGKPSPPPENEWKEQTIGAAVSKPAPPTMPGMAKQPKDDSAGGTKLVVYGTSILIQDELLQSQPIAAHLMLNTVNWLTEQTDKIDVAPRSIEGTPLVLKDSQIRMIFAVCVGLVPGLLFIGGISYSLARRKS